MHQQPSMAPSPTAWRNATLASLSAAVLMACGGGGSSSTVEYEIGGRVDGLTGSGMVLTNGNIESLSVPAAGRFAFAHRLPAGAPYAVAVATQPSGQSCSVAAGSGQVAGKVDTIVVSCQTAAPPPPPPPNTYSVGGNVSGLKGSGLVLQNNRANDLAVASNGAFAFSTRLADGAAYAVSVATQPSGQSCSAANASGGVAAANITNVAVTCQDVAPPPPPPQNYTVGGSIAGLTSAGLVLQNNGGDGITVPSGASAFTFPTAIATGGAYSVRVATQPQGNDCTVANGTGSIAQANVTHVQVSCGPIAPLTLLSSNPANGATEVARNVTPTLTFSAALDAATLTGAGTAARLYRETSDGALIRVDHAAAVQGEVLSFAAQRKLLPGALHWALVTDTVRGTRGERLARTTASAAFTTGDAAWGAGQSFGGELASATDSRAASNRMGDTVVTWLERPATQTDPVRLMARVYNARSGQWGAAEPLASVATINSDGLAAAVADNGDVVVAWAGKAAGSGTPPITIHAHHRPAASGAWAPEYAFPGSTAGVGNADNLAVTVQLDGTAHLSFGDGLSTVRVTTGRAGDAGAWQAPQIVFDEAMGYRARTPIRIVALPAGGAMVASEATANRSDTFGLIRVRRLDAAGAPIGSQVGVFAPDRDVRWAFPSLAVLQVGDTTHVQLAWRFTNDDASGIGLWRWSSATDTWADPVVLGTVPRNERAVSPPIVVAAAGTWGSSAAVHVVWTETALGDGMRRLRGVTAAPTGSPPAATVLLDAAGQVRSADLSIADAPAAAADRAGNVLVVYGHSTVGTGNSVTTVPRALRRLTRTGQWRPSTIEAAPSQYGLSQIRPHLVGAGETGAAWALWTEQTVASPDSRNWRYQLRGRMFD